MTDNSLKKLLQRQEVIPTVSSSMKDALAKDLSLIAHKEAVHLRASAALASSLASNASRLLKLELVTDLTMRAQTEVERLRASAALASSLASSTGHLIRAAEEYEKQFCLPKLIERASLVPNVAKSLSQESERIKRAIEAMDTPWLNIHDNLSSVTSLSKLQEMGHLLNSQPVFGKHLADKLRANLGDWRSKIDWPDDIFVDPLARADFYIERGFDPSLTDFPVPAFDQGVTIARIKSAPPPLIRAYEYEPESESETEDAAFKRTKDAYDWLHRFECHMRKFIDEQMNAEFGDNWAKHQTSGTMYREWRDKQAIARDNGEYEYPLIAYADFTDYEQIITRKDNWEKVFRPIFQRKTLVQESLQRLYPIRICTMHARTITLDDELYLLAETRRLLTATGSTH